MNDRITPVAPAPDSLPHVDAVAPSVFDDVIRNTETHKEQLDTNASFSKNIGELTSAIRFYAKIQAALLVIMCGMFSLLYWRQNVTSDQSFARQRISDVRWQDQQEQMRIVIEQMRLLTARMEKIESK